MEAHLEARVSALEVRTAAIDARLDGIGDRLGRLEGSLDQVLDKLDDIRNREQREFDAQVAWRNRVIGCLEKALANKGLWILLGLWSFGGILLVYGTLVNPPQLSVGLDGFSIAPPAAKVNQDTDEAQETP